MSPPIKRCLASLLTLLLCAPVHGKCIYMVSEAWDGVTNADGTGLYWDVMREIYEPAGYNLEQDVFPYVRAVNMVKNEHADFWVGSYLDEEEAALYPEPDHYFDADTVKAAVRTARSDDFTGQESLEGEIVGWVRGYAYNQYLDVSVNPTRLPRIESGLRMVAHGHIDAVLDDGLEITKAMKSVDLTGDDLTLIKVLDLPLYPAFQGTPRGQKLRDIYDERFPELVESGRMQELYDHYDDYDEYRTGLAD